MRSLKLEVNEKMLWRVIGIGVAVSILGSLAINVMTAVQLGKALSTWLAVWLSDLSSDLIMGGLMMMFMKIAMRGMRRDALPPTETYFIDASEVPVSITVPAALNTNPSPALNERLMELKAASSPEGRQHILDTLRREGLSLQGVMLVDVDLQHANLRGCDLQNANLSKSKLRSANLQEVNLRGANLYMTQLIEANLSGADLSGASLKRTFLSGANLEGVSLTEARVQTSLWGVNLQGADLRGADLREVELFRTDLRGANLAGAHLGDAKINTETILPDGTSWGRNVDITRFTNPSHPNFWQPESPGVPKPPSLPRGSG